MPEDSMIEGAKWLKKSIREKKRSTIWHNNKRSNKLFSGDNRTRCNRRNKHIKCNKKWSNTSSRRIDITPDLIIIDALEHIDTKGVPYESIIKGDAKCYSIGAASIIAKVTRDRIMREWDTIYPQYGFAQHKGYGTKMHMQAIREYGLTPIHRRSFTKNIVHQ